MIKNKIEQSSSKLTWEDFMTMTEPKAVAPAKKTTKKVAKKTTKKVAKKTTKKVAKKTTKKVVAKKKVSKK